MSSSADTVRGWSGREAAPAPARRLPRSARLLGTLLVVAGALGLLWAVVIWRWQDPVTALYTKWEQHELTSAYRQRRASEAGLARLAAEGQLALAARRYRLASRVGDPIGRIEIPRLGLNMILVNGADPGSLRKGPGRDLRSFMPGEGQLVYVAGHRTTFLAPFSHIERLRRGDRVTIELPYATFVYAITSHTIVPADDLAVLRSHGRERLILQACHPRFFASQRYLVYARPVHIELVRASHAAGAAEHPPGW